MRTHLPRFPPKVVTYSPFRRHQRSLFRFNPLSNSKSHNSAAKKIGKASKITIFPWFSRTERGGGGGGGEEGQHTEILTGIITTGKIIKIPIWTDGDT